MNSDITTKNKASRKAGTLVLKQVFVSVLVFFTVFLAWPTKAQNSVSFEMPLMVNNALLGNLIATITEKTHDEQTTTRVTVEKERLRQLLAKLANEEQLASWFGTDVASNDAARGSRGTIGISVSKRDEDTKPQLETEPTNTKSASTVSLMGLRDNGLDINFDPSLLSIDANFPVFLEQSISLRGRRATPDPKNSYAPSKFSSGLNFNITNDFNHRAASGADEGLGQTSVFIDGFTNIGGFGGWSLFYEGDYLEDDDQEFARGDVTLIHDNFKSGVRYAFGDVRPSVSNLQTAPDLLGFSIERDYREINPFKNLRPSGRSTFTLDRPSRVSFELNGAIVETRQLQPGRYSVDDFPFTFGANNVRVIVDDGFSNVEVANFSAFSDIELLAPGLTNFGVSAGVQRLTTGDRSRDYDDDIAVLGFYERGITQKLTLGAQAEVSENHALLASTVAYGSRIGLVGLEVAVSRREDFGTGLSSTLNYENYFNLKSGWDLQTQLQLDYRSSDFGGLTVDGDVSEQWGVFSTLSAYKGDYNLTLTGSTLTDADVTTNSFSASISKSFRRHNLSFNYQYSESDAFEDATSNFSLNITGRFGRSSLQGLYQSADDGFELAYRRPTAFEAGHGGLDQVTLTTNDAIRSAEFAASYFGSKFIVDAEHLETSSQIPGDTSSSTTRFRLGSSIGFAGGQVAVGRPFNDGFIIANTHKNIRGKRVSITRNSTDGQLITRSRHLSALVPINSSYQQQRYIIEVDDLPPGYDIGSGEIDVFPGFLAGYSYKIGSAAANTVIGKVLWPDNTPPSLIVGKLIPETGGDEIAVFTNKTGRFVAERMLPGKYTIIFNDGYDDFVNEFEIEKRKEPGLIRLDTITLEPMKLDTISLK